MPARQFEQCLQRLSSLTRRRPARLATLLHAAAALDRALDVIEHTDRLAACPRCRAADPYRHGHAHGLQRYRCRACARRYLSHHFGGRWALHGARIASPEAFLRAALGRFDI